MAKQKNSPGLLEDLRDDAEYNAFCTSITKLDYEDDVTDYEEVWNLLAQLPTAGGSKLYLSVGWAGTVPSKIWQLKVVDVRGNTTDVGGGKTIHEAYKSLVATLRN